MPQTHVNLTFNTHRQSEKAIYRLFLDQAYLVKRRNKFRNMIARWIQADRLQGRGDSYVRKLTRFLRYTNNCEWTRMSDIENHMRNQ